MAFFNNKDRQMSFAVFGTGGFGRELMAVVAEMAELAYPDSLPPVFVDDNSRATHGQYRTISFEELCLPEHRQRSVVIAVGDGRVRQRLDDRCREAGLNITTLFAPTFRNPAEIQAGAGSVFCDHTMVTTDAVIGRQFQCNIYSYVAHDCRIGDFVTFAPRVCCNGNVHVGDFAYVGTGAVFLQGNSTRPLVIGEGAVIGAGAVVTADVEPYTVVAGVPAKLIRRLEPQ